MKKFLLSLAAVACACAMNAQNGAPLYATGDFAASKWAPEAPATFNWDGSNYTLDIDDVSMVKISTTMGDWDTFNMGAIGVAGDAVVGDNPLEPWGENTNMPWGGHWKLTVNADLSVLNLWTDTPKPEGFTPLYLRGPFSGESWDANPDYEFSTTDGQVYTYTCTFDPANAFKIADAKWSKYNFGLVEAGLVFLDEETLCWNNGGSKDMQLYLDAPAAVTFTMNVVDEILVVTLAGGVETVGVNAAPAVYYNLQGVQVANPENGLYIVKQGNKVSKVLVK